MSKFTVAWIIWAVWFAVWETWAILDRKPGGTLSEHIWWLIAHGGSLIAFLVVAFCLWLAWHFVFERQVP